MDKLYMILLCLMIVPILICIKYSRKIKCFALFKSSSISKNIASPSG